MPATPLTSNATLAYAPARRRRIDADNNDMAGLAAAFRRAWTINQARGARWTAMPPPSTEVGWIWRAFVVLRATMAGSGPPFRSLAWPKGAGRGRKRRGDVATALAIARA
ncbi:hypothetical protein G3N96_27585 [Burkholderia sp. Se-20373]|uniref:hypothetical protein n=1 Tax=Burkholderia sp. Se-20373 TaxID=2703898 RepID=UPI001980F2D4|nr:hypothetical protein [Burkholderia sp. Se-20373]MBN3749161.1 hypothetical protein [Burkholderia sp. Se-20373]